MGIYDKNTKKSQQCSFVCPLSNAILAQYIAVWIVKDSVLIFWYKCEKDYS